jgi:ABC-2 type transport system permease protein
MKNIITIAKKEWKNYFTSPVGYIFAGLLLIVTNWLFFNSFFIVGQADLNPYWTNMALLLSLFVPAISMGLVADEKKNSTWEVLLSLPIDEKQLVLGKFFGCALYLLFSILLSIPVIITVYFLGKPDVGAIFGGLVGTIFLSLAYLSLGLFMSSLSSQSIVAFLGSSVLLIINNLLGQDVLLSKVPTMAKDFIGGLSLSWRSSRFSSGLIEINDLIFFVSWIIIFITLTVLSLKSRNK